MLIASVVGLLFIDDNSFASLAERATDLIQWVVYYGLVLSSKPDGLNVVSAVARAIDQLDIFTLNHDLLLEAQLNQDSIPFKDGFSNQQGDAKANAERPMCLQTLRCFYLRCPSIIFHQESIPP